MKDIFFVFIGGGLGSICRYAGGKWIHQFSLGAFPYATLIINIVACFILGIAAGSQLEKSYTESYVKFFLMIGFCGGFSTFSAFSYESVQLIHQGKYLFLASYIGLSFILCISVTFAGLMIGSRI